VKKFILSRMATLVVGAPLAVATAGSASAAALSPPTNVRVWPTPGNGSIDVNWDPPFDIQAGTSGLIYTVYMDGRDVSGRLYTGRYYNIPDRVAPNSGTHTFQVGVNGAYSRELISSPVSKYISMPARRVAPTFAGIRQSTHAVQAAGAGKITVSGRVSNATGGRVTLLFKGVERRTGYVTPHGSFTLTWDPAKATTDQRGTVAVRFGGDAKVFAGTKAVGTLAIK